jgi:predicted phosphate transport protein (TIGR00153 family)
VARDVQESEAIIGFPSRLFSVTVANSSPKGSHPDVDDGVSVLFTLVRESLGWATSALLDQDYAVAERVVAGDEDIDRHCDELEASIQERLGGATSDLDELEELVSILQLVSELERSADLAKHIAHRSMEGLGGVITPRSRGLIQAMSDITLGMWSLARDAYTKRSRDVGFRLEESDHELDGLCAALVTEGLSQRDDPKIAVDLALIARFYERLGDHAVNLARRVDKMAAPRRLSGARIPVPLGTGPTTDKEKSTWLGRFRAWLQGLRLVPRDNEFFELFNAAAVNARDCAEELRKLGTSFSDIEERFEQIRGLERRGDEITVDVLRLLDASFVPPFDREDVHALVEELDDVVDDMFAAASLIHIVHVDKPLPDVIDLTELLVSMADEMVALLDCLRTKEGARFRLEKIEQLEHQGDAVFRRAMEHLFSGQYDAVEIIKWKDIVQSLEDSLNAIEHVSDVVESILIKNG